MHMSGELSILKDPCLLGPLEELEQLLSQTPKAFLLGAGCSVCAGLPTMMELTARVETDLPGGSSGRRVLDELLASLAGEGQPNIEDYMSELVDLLSLAKRRESCSATTCEIAIGDSLFSALQLEEALEEIKQATADCLIPDNCPASSHQAFVSALHRTLQAGRGHQSEPVDYFVLNYDTLIEDALSLEKVLLADGFEGGTTAWWNEDTYDDRPVRARVFKLHGSIDWRVLEGETTPRRIRPSLRDETGSGRLLIWPAATKYQEAQRDPFAQIMTRLRARLRPGKGSELVVAVIGYSFGDAHVNVELDQAVRDSEGRLTIVALSSDEVPGGLLSEWLDDPDVREHVRVYARRGFYHGSETVKVDVDVPWWRFEVFTKLIGGVR